MKIIEVGVLFQHCVSLGRIKLTGVRVIEKDAFCRCTALEDVEFGNKLDKIGSDAFTRTSLRSIKLPKIRAIEAAFAHCEQLTEVDLPEDLEGIGSGVFQRCPLLRRIAILLKNNILNNGDFSIFLECDNLSQVDLVGGIRKTTISPHCS